MITSDSKGKKEVERQAPRITPEEWLAELSYNPRDSGKHYESVEQVRAEFGLPVTMGTNEDTRLALDHAFEGYDTLYQSLTQHAVNMGQFPMTSFVGYAVLQQIAQNGMIRTCIQTVADDCTREWIKITGGEDTDEAILSSITDRQGNYYKLRGLFNRAVATVGYNGGAFIYIDTGTDDPSLPLIIDETSEEFSAGHYLRFVLIDPVNVSPAEYNANDPLCEDYMVPKAWWVLGKKVDASRLIVLKDNEPPVLLRPAYNFLGIPQAQILWDYVLHWNRARVAGAGILEKLNFLIYKTNMSDLMARAGGLAELDAKVNTINRYRSNDSIFVCDKENEDVQNVTLTISSVTDLIRQSWEFIAAMNRTPAVKLLGISPSGFNATGESDIRNYYDHIRSKQELLRDGIQKCLDVIQLVTTGTIDPSISFEFNELGKEDKASNAMTASTRAQMLGMLQDRNVISAEEVRSAVKADPMMGLGNLDDEMPEGEEGDMQTDDPDSQAMMEQFMAQQAAQGQPQAQGQVPMQAPQGQEPPQEEG